MSDALAPYNQHLSKEALGDKGRVWKQAKEVKEEIQRQLEGFKLDDITPEVVLGKLYMIIHDDGGEFKGSDKIRATELLGKWLKLFRDVENQVNIANIGEDALKAIIDKRVTPNKSEPENKKPDTPKSSNDTTLQDGE